MEQIKNMKSPTLTFCTYTYNDAEFVEDLVRESMSFTVQPDEIVVVDDGSDVPFSMKNAPDNLRVIRSECNQGITLAKGTGLSAATSDIIFSMDCDTRVNPDWLERNLPYLDDPGIGLVGGSLVYKSGDDLVSRYLSIFGDNHNQHHVGPVDFIPGNAFLLHRRTWEQAGGFTAYNETNCQDHYLCNRLKSQGYSLYSNAKAQAWQLRRITRTTMCKRVWKWCHKPIKKQASQAGDVMTYLFGTLVAPMLDRCHHAAKKGEPLFYYLELLYLSHAIVDTLDYLAESGAVTQEICQGFMLGLAELFEGAPRIWALFKADLTAMGHTLVLPTLGNVPSWSEFFMFSEMFKNAGIFTWLNRDGAIQLIRDEMDEKYHFSSYATASFAM